MKKFLSFLLAFAMIFSATFALAEGAASESAVFTESYTYSDFSLAAYNADGISNIDLTGLKFNEKFMLGQYGLEHMISIGFNEKDILNAVFQLSPEGVIYFGADRLSKVYALDAKAICKELFGIFSNIYRDFLSFYQLTDKDVKEIMKGALETIVGVGGELVKTVAGEIVEAAKALAANTTVNFSFGSTDKDICGEATACGYANVSFAFTLPLTIAGKQVTAADVTLCVANTEDPSSMSLAVTLVGEKDILHVGELQISVPDAETFNVSVLCNGETVLDGSYAEDSKGAYNLTMAGNQYDLIVNGNDIEDTASTHYDMTGVLYAKTKAQLGMMTATYDRIGEQLASSLMFAASPYGALNADFVGTCKKSDTGFAVAGEFDSYLIYDKAKGCSFSCNIEIVSDTEDETVDLSDAEKYEINSIATFAEFLEDETFNRDLSAMMLSVLGEFATIPAINQAIAAAN